MGSSARILLPDGSYVDWSIKRIRADQWRPHGIRYRIAWIQYGKCRVLFDNHHGKHDHCHIDEAEKPYSFSTVENLWADFKVEIKKLGARV